MHRLECTSLDMPRSVSVAVVEHIASRADHSEPRTQHLHAFLSLTMLCTLEEPQSQRRCTKGKIRQFNQAVNGKILWTFSFDPQ